MPAIRDCGGCCKSPRRMKKGRWSLPPPLRDDFTVITSGRSFHRHRDETFTITVAPATGKMIFLISHLVHPVDKIGDTGDRFLVDSADDITWLKPAPSSRAAFNNLCHHDASKRGTIGFFRQIELFTRSRVQRINGKAKAGNECERSTGGALPASRPFSSACSSSPKVTLSIFSRPSRITLTLTSLPIVVSATILGRLRISSMVLPSNSTTISLVSNPAACAGPSG